MAAQLSYPYNAMYLTPMILEEPASGIAWHIDLIIYIRIVVFYGGGGLFLPDSRSKLDTVSDFHPLVFSAIYYRHKRVGASMTTRYSRLESRGMK